MAEPMPASELDAIRERGPVGYYCDHSDEPSANSSHHAWEWVEGEGLVFQPTPSVSMSLTHPKNRAGSGDSRQCPRAVPVYAVDVPALLTEVERLRDVEYERNRFQLALEEITTHRAGRDSSWRDAAPIARAALDAARPSTTEEGK